MEKNAIVSRPSLEGCRYDAVVDWERRLYRAQIKYADRKSGHAEGSVVLEFKMTTRSGRKCLPYYTCDEIDVLLVYVPKIDRVLWLGPEQFHEKKQIVIRYQPSKNNQSKGCLFADDFLW